MSKLQFIDDTAVMAPFGRRKVAPRACVVDSKPHIRSFLSEALEEIGFITYECDQVATIDAIVADKYPDLIVLGLSAGGIAANATLDALQAKKFDGKPF